MADSNWTTAALGVADAIERAAARAWADNRDGGRAVRYHTELGAIRAEMTRKPETGELALAWYGPADGGISRAWAVELISRRMASRLG